jgi:hypothetical protein
VQSPWPAQAVLVGAYMQGLSLQQGVSLLQFWPK